MAKGFFVNPVKGELRFLLLTCALCDVEVKTSSLGIQRCATHVATQITSFTAADLGKLVRLFFFFF